MVLYTTGCPRCEMLEKLLNDKGLKYEVCTDKDVMAGKGFETVPMLEVDGKTMNYKDAVRWVQNM